MYRIISLATLLLMLISTPIHANNERIMLVMDASGSMWGQLQGKAKIQIARGALNKLIENWSDNKEVGLVAYGHRRKGDCNDIQTLIPIGRLNSSKMRAVVDGISPKGKTPLSAAVKHAATELKYTNSKATVILISDGIETCKKDPCELGAALEKNGVDFTTHVIGFDVKGPDQAGLRCLAKNTGGLFIPANNAEELQSALNQAVAPPKPRPLPKASLDAPKTAGKGSVITIIPKADKPNFRGFINLYPKTGGDYVRTEQVGADYAPVSMSLPLETGSFVLKWESMRQELLAERPISIVESATEIIAPEKAKRASSVDIQLKGPEGTEGYIRIFQKVNEEHIAEHRIGVDEAKLTIRMPVAPGEYRLEWINTRMESVAKRMITLEQAPIELAAPTSAKKSSEVSVAFTAPEDLGGYVFVYAKGDEYPLSEHRIGDYFTDGLFIQLPEKSGSYTLQWATLEGEVFAETSINVVD